MVEFVDSTKYFGERKFNRPIIFDELKELKRIKVDQKLEVIRESDNLERLEDYRRMELKVVPIQRISENGFASVGRKSFPPRVMVEMTGRCNLKCRMCPRKSMTRPLVNMNKNLYMKIIDELDRYGVDAFWFFHFGESVTHPDWKEIVSYADKKENLGIRWFSTNGVVFNEEAIDFVLNSRITFLNYSMHATNAYVYSFVSLKENYLKVRSNFEKLLVRKRELGRGPIIHVQMIDQEGTHNNINEFVETFYSMEGVEIVSILSLEYVYVEGNEFGKKRDRLATVKRCNRISREDCFVHCSGKVVLCDADFNDEEAIGDLNESSLSEIWNSEKRKEILRLNDAGEMYKREFCLKCTDFDF